MWNCMLGGVWVVLGLCLMQLLDGLLSDAEVAECRDERRAADGRGSICGRLRRRNVSKVL